MEIKRDDYLKELINAKNNGLIKVITGLRRSGKSYLLKTLYKNYLLNNGISENQIIDIALDTTTNESLRNPLGLSAFIKEKIGKSKQMFLFIDEIQKCEEIPNPAFEKSQFESGEVPKITFHSVLNEVLAEYKNVDCYVTGSNSKMLSGDIVTDFRGRAWEIKVFPLSFKEINPLLPNDEMNNFITYMKYGGMPLLLNFKSEKEKKAYLMSLFSETYLKDICERNAIKDSEKLMEMIKVLASTTGSLTNVTKLTDTFKSVSDKSISRATIESYMKAIKDAFLVLETNRYDIRGRKIISSTNKYYFTDTGLRNAVLNFSSNDYGHLMESIIYLELVRRGYTVNVGVVDAWESKSRRASYEVDFIAEFADRKFYIQSAYDLYDQEKLKKESKPLSLIGNNFKKIMVHFDSFTDNYDEDGIFHIGIPKFLLDDRVLS